MNFKISSRLKKYLVTAVSFLIIAILVGFWFANRNLLSTEDAYINANIVQITARISGQVAHIHVENNQSVKKGQLLFELDENPFALAVKKAEAQLAIAEADFHSAQLAATRAVKLAEMHALPKQSEDDSLAKLQSATAAVKLYQANLAQAELDLSYTKISAPTDGLVTNMTLREGNTVTANQPLFALISNEQYWVDTNFKETELKNIIVGLSAKVVVDMYKNHVFNGIVESISGGSGTAFSLLPPQNAAGNWIKVTQRVPVKIRILNPDPHFPLRIGTTATVTIDTSSKVKID